MLLLKQSYNPWDGVFGKKSNAAGSITGTKKIGGITKVDTVVVGSGISGATAAFYLHNKGIDVLLTEAKDQVGGNLISKKGRQKDGQVITCITATSNQN
jgi:NADPH-dependent 2,4-dienoyl-CoA reductase/sulfur reductase-like enzyme